MRPAVIFQISQIPGAVGVVAMADIGAVKNGLRLILFDAAVKGQRRAGVWDGDPFEWR